MPFDLVAGFAVLLDTLLTTDLESSWSSSSSEDSATFFFLFFAKSINLLIIYLHKIMKNSPGLCRIKSKKNPLPILVKEIKNNRKHVS